MHENTGSKMSEVINGRRGLLRATLKSGKKEKGEEGKTKRKIKSQKTETTEFPV